MFDVGFWELVLIAVVALVVIGPERLPKVARIAGMWLGRARRTLASVKEEIDRELKAEELKEILEKQARSNPLESILEKESIPYKGSVPHKGSILDAPSTPARSVADAPAQPKPAGHGVSDQRPADPRDA